MDQDGSHDIIEKLEGAIVQHGPHNDRVYLMKSPDCGTPPSLLLVRLDALAREKGYGKVFVKIPETLWPAFSATGYHREAIVPEYYPDGRACIFAARFYDPDRAKERDATQIREVMETCGLPSGHGDRNAAAAVEIVGCTPGDAEEMKTLFREVFVTYPFPIHDPSYLRAAMDTGTRFVGVRQEARLVALASLEPDACGSAAEMGDFATLPDWQGQGMARHLLTRLDLLAKEMGLTTTCTIVRALSFSMNRVFSCCGYRHAGLLVNNSQIAGSIQSMNIWYKPVEPKFLRGRFSSSC